MAGGRNERVTDLFFLDQTSAGDPGEEGLVRRVSNDLKIYLNSTVHSLLTGSGITESAHEVLDTLVHQIAESCYFEVTRSQGRVTDLTWWTNSGKTVKVREINVTRTSGKISQIVVKQYDGTGTIITGQTLTGTVARTGGRVDSITWVQT